MAVPGCPDNHLEVLTPMMMNRYAQVQANSANTACKEHTTHHRCMSLTLIDALSAAPSTVPAHDTLHMQGSTLPTSRALGNSYMEARISIGVP